MRADARRNRQTVIEAGARLLATRPQASMQEIADASGLGRTTVYRHFRAREELVAALVAQVAEEATQRAAAAQARQGPATEVLRHLAADMFALGRRYAFLRSQREDVQQSMGESDAAFVRWAQSAQARGELRDDVSPLWILSGVRGLITAAIDDAEALGSHDQVIKKLGDTLVAAFGPTPAR